MPSAPPPPNDGAGDGGDEHRSISQATPSDRPSSPGGTAAVVGDAEESGEGGAGSGELKGGMPVYLPRYEP